MKRLVTATVALVVAMAAIGYLPPPPASSQITPLPPAASPDSQKPLEDNYGESDAEIYASDYRVSIEEASRRLDLQKNEIGDLRVGLSDNESDDFAGLWIEHEPEFRVVVRFTQGGFKRVAPYIKGTPLENIVDVKSAKFALEDLVLAQYRSSRKLDALKIRHDSTIDVAKNRVELYVTKPAKLETTLSSNGVSLPNSAAVIDVPGLSKPSARLYGGNWLYLANSTPWCTAGFSVKHHSKGLGITTAGHCPPSPYRGDNRQLYFSYKRLPLVGSGREYGSYDVQWHKPNGHRPVQRFYHDGYSTRPVTGARGWKRVGKGDRVCHYGMTTGKTCGNIRNKYYAPSYISNAQKRFVVVHNRYNRDISGNGDSGGPWYNGQIAYGIHSGTAPYGNQGYIDGIYMPINYVRDLGLWVRW